MKTFTDIRATPENYINTLKSILEESYSGAFVNFSLDIHIEADAENPNVAKISYSLEKTTLITE